MDAILVSHVDSPRDRFQARKSVARVLSIENGGVPTLGADHSHVDYRHDRFLASHVLKRLTTLLANKRLRHTL
jgi:hypothetical protein